MTRHTLRVGEYELTVLVRDGWLVIRRDGTAATDEYAASDWGDGERTWWPSQCDLDTEEVNRDVWGDPQAQAWASEWLDACCEVLA